MLKNEITNFLSSFPKKLDYNIATHCASCGFVTETLYECKFTYITAARQSALVQLFLLLLLIIAPCKYSSGAAVKIAAT